MNGLSNYEKEERPWGNFERFTLNEKTTVKIITVSAGEAISLQTHAGRDEFWRVLAGAGTITIDREQSSVREGESFFSPRGSKHRIEGGAAGLPVLLNVF